MICISSYLSKHFTFRHLADTLIKSDLQGHSPEAIRVKCIAQGHNIILGVWESNQHSSDY